MTQTTPQTTIRFSATDTLFFRESRPMEAMGELQSLFPPSMRTLSGAIRTSIGEQEQVNWKAFHADKHHPLRKIIGHPNNNTTQKDDLGVLSFKGSWLYKGKQRLYPAPLHLMKKEDELFELCLATKGEYCDLGKNVRLPHLPNDDAKGSKALENVWIDGETLSTLLQGEPVTYDKAHFFALEQLLTKESRIGIARDNKTRTVKEGMLYQTQHIRLRDDVGIEVDITGLADQYHTSSMIRLGGEGRSAHLSVSKHTHTLPSVCFSKPDNTFDKNNYQGIMLYLLTPLYLPYSSTNTWTPLPSFNKHEFSNKTTYWQGEIKGITLKLHGAITGKVIRQGGWDLATNTPRQVKSFIPAGSVFYCESPDPNLDLDLKEVIETLHDKQIGGLQQYGYGHIAAGLWKKQKTTES